jgi:hypothetical protein
MSHVSEINRDLKILPCLSMLGEEDLSIVGEKAYAKRFAKNEVVFMESDKMEFFLVH